jgi:hypothetical protein
MTILGRFQKSESSSGSDTNIDGNTDEDGVDAESKPTGKPIVSGDVPQLDEGTVTIVIIT